MGAYADAEASIRSRMETQWATLHSDVPLYFENEAINTDELDPLNNVSYVVVEIRAGSERHAEFGAGSGHNRWRKSGEVIIRVFVLVNTDKAVLNGLVDDAAAVFRGWQSGDLKFFEVGDASGGQTQEHGHWFERAAIAAFTFDLTG